MNPTPLIDAHCHLDFDVFDKDRDRVLQNARAAGIEQIIIPGTRAQHWPRIHRLVSQSQSVVRLHACYGLHPYWRHEQDDLDKLQRLLEQEQQQARVVALGECGLDFRKQLCPQAADKHRQTDSFEAQLAIADRLQLPVVIHAVQATEAVIQSLQHFPALRGMIHSYSGSREQAEKLMAQGFCLSLGGAITHTGAKKPQALARELPLSHLLLETDAPDQPPQGHQGQRNEPALLNLILEKMAQLRGEDREEIAARTRQNSIDLFGLPET